MSAPQADDFAPLQAVLMVAHNCVANHSANVYPAQLQQLIDAREALTRLRAERDSHQRVAIAAMAERDDWRKLAVELGANGKATRDLHRNDLTLSMRVDAGLLRLGKLDVLTTTFQNMRDQYAEWLKADAARSTPAPGEQT